MSETTYEVTLQSCTGASTKVRVTAKRDEQACARAERDVNRLDPEGNWRSVRAEQVGF